MVLAAQLDARGAEASILERESKRYWTLVKLAKHKGEVLDGVVVDIMDEARNRVSVLLSESAFVHNLSLRHKVPLGEAVKLRIESADPRRDLLGAQVRAAPVRQASRLWAELAVTRRFLWRVGCLIVKFWNLREGGRSMDKTEVEAFQVEVEKRGRVEMVDLFVGTVRGLRGRRKLVGEALMSDPYTPIINFHVKHAEDIDDLLHRFLTQLINRGYRPLRTRCSKAGQYEEWLAVSAEAYDLTDLNVKHSVETQEV